MSMRNVIKTKMVRLSEENLKRLEKDRKHFQKVIGGGSWSLNDAFNEYLKLLDMVRDR